MAQGQKFYDWKEKEEKKAFALKQLANLQKVVGDETIASFIMRICGPGQVETMLKLYAHSKHSIDRTIQALIGKDNDRFLQRFPDIIDRVDLEINHLERIHDNLLKQGRIKDDNTIPDYLKEVKNYARLRKVILGTLELLENYKSHLFDTEIIFSMARPMNTEKRAILIKKKNQNS